MLKPQLFGWPTVIADAARTAAAAAISFLIARLFGLPEAYWAPIITLVIMQSTLSATIQISLERFIGTILGAVAGGLLAGRFPQVWWMFALGIFVLGIVCALLRLNNSYRFAGVTLAIVILIPHTASPWAVALHRSIEVSIGIVVGLVMAAIWPDPTWSASRKVS